MAISWIKVLQATPGAKRAIDALVGPGGSSSATIWYNLIKTVITLLTACGVGVVLSEQDMLTLGSLLALVVPALATIADMISNFWLRIRTKEPLAAKVREERSNA